MECFERFLVRCGFPPGSGQVAEPATLGQMPNEKMPSAVEVACWSMLNMWGECLISHFAFISCTPATPATVASLRRGWHTYKCGFHRAWSCLGVSQCYSSLHLSITDQFHMGVRNTRPKVMVTLWLCGGRWGLKVNGNTQLLSADAETWVSNPTQEDQQTFLNESGKVSENGQVSWIYSIEGV